MSKVPNVTFRMFIAEYPLSGVSCYLRVKIRDKEGEIGKVGSFSPEGRNVSYHTVYMENRWEVEIVLSKIKSKATSDTKNKTIKIRLDAEALSQFRNHSRKFLEDVRDGKVLDSNGIIKPEFQSKLIFKFGNLYNTYNVYLQQVKLSLESDERTTYLGVVDNKENIGMIYLPMLNELVNDLLSSTSKIIDWYNNALNMYLKIHNAKETQV